MDQQPVEEAQAIDLSDTVIEEAQVLNLPGGISEGMPVFDSADQAVGTVQLVYYGGASDEAIERALRLREVVGAAPQSDMGTFSADVPPELQARLMRQGYVRIEGPGLTGLSCYITPEQISGLVGGQVVLTTTREVLTTPRP